MTYDDVLLIINDNSQNSKDIGNYFKVQRDISDSRTVYINTPDSETITLANFNSQIRTPIENFLISNNLIDTINYIVTTKGVPLKITDTPGRSVDSELTLILGSYSGAIGVTGKVLNPYFNRNEHFSGTKFGIYLVTRLTGYFYSDVKRMIDNSSIADQTNHNGIFVLDVAPSKDGTTYQIYNNQMRAAKPILEMKGYTVILDETTTFVTNQNNVLGYVSWGSNDPSYTDNAKPHNTWAPGSLAETAVSSSARTFIYPPVYGQSLIADLIAEGITGAKGYVYEPYLSAVAHPDILFDRYTDFYNLAESYYMASNYIGWMDVIVGDPKTNIIGYPIPESSMIIY